MTNPIPERLATALADRYRIQRELGAGGMATVAAVLGAERFLTEIKTTANLQHPHILSLHDSGEVNGAVFYVMLYVEGDAPQRGSCGPLPRRARAGPGYRRDPQQAPVSFSDGATQCIRDCCLELWIRHRTSCEQSHIATEKKFAAPLAARRFT